MVKKERLESFVNVPLADKVRQLEGQMRALLTEKQVPYLHFKGDGIIVPSTNSEIAYIYILASDGFLYVKYKSGSTQRLDTTGAATDHGALTGLDDNDHGAIYYTEAEVGALSQDGLWVFAADGEASDTYKISLNPDLTSYAVGMKVAFKANTVNIGPATLEIEALGAKAIKKHHDQDLANGDMSLAIGTLTPLSFINAVLDSSQCSIHISYLILFGGTLWKLSLIH